MLLLDGGPLRVVADSGDAILARHDALRFWPEDPAELRLSADGMARVLLAEFVFPGEHTRDGRVEPTG